MKKNYKKTGMLLIAILFAGISSLQTLSAQTMTNYAGWGVSASLLVDGTLGGGNQWGGPTPGWAEFQYSSTQVWNAYAITSGTSGANATGWTISGSNDGLAWTALDTQTGISWTGNNQVKNFTFSNSIAYLYYKLNVTTDDTGWGFYIGEFTFSNTGGTTKLNDIKNNTMTLNTNSSKSQLTINFGKQVSSEQVDIYDIKGSKVMNVIVSAETYVLDIQNLKSGMYIVKSSQGTDRFIK